jgi:protein-disulfide isomerase
VDASSDGQTDNTTAALLNAPSSQFRAPETEVELAVPVELLGFNLGDDQAPVRIIEMSDYGCGYCRRFHLETFPTLLEEFVLSGKVEWKFMPFVTGMFDNSLAATTAAECTLAQSDDLFVVMNERLWEGQAEWKGDDDPAGTTRAWAAEIGVDMAAFDTCVGEEERLPRIASATGVAGQLGVRGTPTFFILGYPPIQGALPTETFQEVLTMVHEAATGGDPIGN